jgi:RNA polymerase sigma-70 factor (ECF subfamily)
LKKYSDKELISMFSASGSREQAFTQIMEKYQRKLYWHVRHIVISHEDADDVLQNTFLKVWNNLNRFRGSSGLYTWLYRVATNEALSFLKKEKRKGFLPWEGYEKQLEESLESDAYFSGEEIAEKLQKALLKLPEKQRLVFNMKYFEDLKFEEISEILGTSVGALKASYHHAVKKIEQFVSRD